MGYQLIFGKKSVRVDMYGIVSTMSTEREHSCSVRHVGFVGVSVSARNPTAREVQAAQVALDPLKKRLGLEGSFPISQNSKKSLVKSLIQSIRKRT